MRILLNAIFFLVIAALGMDVQIGHAEPYEKIAKIKVTKEGLIYLDKKNISISEMAEALDQLKKENGAVWYTRDDTKQEPTQEQFEAFQKIVDKRLPIKLVENDADW